MALRWKSGLPENLVPRAWKRRPPKQSWSFLEIVVNSMRLFLCLCSKTYVVQRVESILGARWSVDCQNCACRASFQCWRSDKNLDICWSQGRHQRIICRENPSRHSVFGLGVGNYVSTNSRWHCDRLFSAMDGEIPDCWGFSEGISRGMNVYFKITVQDTPKSKLFLSFLGVCMSTKHAISRGTKPFVDALRCVLFQSCRAV